MEIKKQYIIIIAVLIFFISTAVRYWPVYHKGFSYNIVIDDLILARNLSLVGEYKIDNEKNVFLSSEVVKERGIISNFGNKLTPILYSKVFNLFGFNQSIPLYVSLVLYGIVSALLFVLVSKLFNIRVALIFAFIDIFSPLIIKEAIQPGFLEWAALFLGISLLIYLWKEKPNLFRLFLAGLFFGLASLARNSYLLSFFPFLVYDFWKTRSFKRAIIFILPLLICWSVYLGPAFIEKGIIENSYLSRKETTSSYMHIFPDPYTWHFERDAYVESVWESEDYNYDYSQFLSKYGYSIGLKNKILMYWASATSYPKGLIAQTTIGGPFLVFFLIIGGFYLYRKKKDLLKLFILWAGTLYLLLVINQSNHWGHFTALELPIFLLISLSIYWLIQLILKQNFKAYFKYLLIFGFIVTLFLHLIQSDKWAFHEGYLYSETEKTLELVKVVEEQKNEIDKKNDVIAVGSPNSQAPAILNWYTDFSSVYFNSVTVKRLLQENKLQWAFDQFGVTRIIGYDRDLTEKILGATNVESIAIFDSKH
jgi:hypothetical protein